MTGRRSLLRSMACGLAAPSLGFAQGVDSWPSRPLRLIVPFGPGGANDIIARLVAERLAPLLGQRVLVENRSGANGMIGAQAVASAAPDGYTFLSASPGPLSVNQFLYRQMPYDPGRDFTSVAVMARVPYLLAVSPTLPVQNVGEFLAYARSHPGVLNYASTGSAARLTVELLQSMAGGLRLTLVNYRGAGPALIDLRRGDVQFICDQMPGLLEAARDGGLRPIGVGSAARSAAMPDVPTIAEAGVPGYEASAWLAFAAPAQTPRPIRERLASLIEGVVRQPETAARLAALGADPGGGTPDEMDRLLDEERRKWGAIVQTARIELE